MTPRDVSGGGSWVSSLLSWSRVEIMVHQGRAIVYDGFDVVLWYVQ